MRCKKHVPDLTSTVGVCATCLRERLEALIAAQAQAQAQAQPARVVPRAASEPNPPPPLNFPRSVSPYVSHRKSDSAACHRRDRRRERLFYSTPQAGPTFCGGGDATAKTASSKKRPSKFWILSNLFRTRSDKVEPDSHRRSSSRESCEPSSSASPSWFSLILPARRQNHDFPAGSCEDSAVRGRRRCRQTDRGMSPVRKENLNDEFDGNDGSLSGSDCSSESSPQRRKTPAVAPSARRSRLGPGKTVSGMAFCLSPLVRASPNPNPNPHWSHKGLGPEMGAAVAGVHIAAAASFCANRSRKLADFGRVNHNR